MDPGATNTCPLAAVPIIAATMVADDLEAILVLVERGHDTTESIRESAAILHANAGDAQLPGGRKVAAHHAAAGKSPAMCDDDLQNLIGFLGCMGPQEQVRLGPTFTCSASELLSVAEQAAAWRDARSKTDTGS